MSPVKPLMGAYPYLRISKTYDVPYGDVLLIADAMKEEACNFGALLHGYQRRGINISRIIQKIIQGKPDEFQVNQFALAMNLADRNFRDIQQRGWDQS